MDEVQKYAAKIAEQMKAKRGGKDPGDTNSANDIAAKRAEQQDAIIEAIENGSTQADAARAAGVRRETVWEWRNKDDAFAERFRIAKDTGKVRSETRIKQLTDDCRILALEVLHNALSGERVTREQMTVAIFTAKAKHGWVETQRVENMERVRIIDDTAEV